MYIPWIDCTGGGFGFEFRNLGKYYIVECAPCKDPQTHLIDWSLTLFHGDNADIPVSFGVYPGAHHAKKAGAALISLIKGEPIPESSALFM